MPCDQMKELLVSALYNEAMSAEEQQQLQTHLAACADCREEMAGFTETRRILAQWEVEAPPAPFIFVAADPVVKWPARLKQLFAVWVLPVARLGYRGAVAAMVLLGILALLNTEISWDHNRIAFHTFLNKPKSPTSEGTINPKLVEPDSPGAASTPASGSRSDLASVTSSGLGSRRLSDDEIVELVNDRINESELFLFKKWLALTEEERMEQGRQARRQFVALQRQVGQLRKQVMEDGNESQNQKLNLDKN